MVNLLAQLSQRLIGELIVYPRSGVCPSSSLKPPLSDLDIFYDKVKIMIWKAQRVPQ